MANKHDKPLDLMIYSAIPTIYSDPMEAITAGRAYNNGSETRYHCAAPTGWTLDQSLMGSQWRNLWIACPVTMGRAGHLGESQGQHFQPGDLVFGRFGTEKVHH